MRRLETILQIRKKAAFPNVISKPIIYIFFKNFTNNRKKTTKQSGQCPIQGLFDSVELFAQKDEKHYFKKVQSLPNNFFLKVVPATFLLIYFLSLNKRTCQTREKILFHFKSYFRF